MTDPKGILGDVYLDEMFLLKWTDVSTEYEIAYSAPLEQGKDCFRSRFLSCCGGHQGTC